MLGGEDSPVWNQVGSHVQNMLCSGSGQNKYQGRVLAQLAGQEGVFLHEIHGYPAHSPDPAVMIKEESFTMDDPHAF